MLMKRQRCASLTKTIINERASDRASVEREETVFSPRYCVLQILIHSISAGGALSFFARLILFIVIFCFTHNFKEVANCRHFTFFESKMAMNGAHFTDD